MPSSYYMNKSKTNQCLKPYQRHLNKNNYILVMVQFLPSVDLKVSKYASWSWIVCNIVPPPLKSWFSKNRITSSGVMDSGIPVTSTKSMGRLSMISFAMNSSLSFSLGRSLGSPSMFTWCWTVIAYASWIRSLLKITLSATKSKL